MITWRGPSPRWVGGRGVEGGRVLFVCVLHLPTCKHYSPISLPLQENYVRRLHNLLFLEEYQQRSDMSRYDLIDVSVEFVSNYNQGEQLNIAPPGTSYVRLEAEEELFEGRRSIK